VAVAFNGLLANPGAVLFRLQSRALAEGHAREDVVTRNGHLRLSVHRMRANAFVWRADDMGERPQARSTEGMTLPRLTAGPSGTVLFMNEASRRLFGGRIKSLDRIFRDLPLESTAIETPVGPMQGQAIEGKKLALVSILRAGNGLLDGILELIPAARVGFVGLYRDPVTLQPVQYYCKLPTQMEDRLAIVVDPMLATGNSSAAAVDLLKQSGARNIRFLCLLAAPEGVQRMKEAHPDVPIITAAVDSHLNDHGYIVPGLGDAGDRMFGTK